MPENETLPKTGKSKDWLNYADKKLQEFRDYHSSTNIIGQLKHPDVLGDDYSRVLSNNELQARKMGMDLLRKETAEKSNTETPSYRKGGRIKRSGPTRLHAGEKVVTNNRKARKPGRSTARR